MSCSRTCARRPSMRRWRSSAGITSAVWMASACSWMSNGFTVSANSPSSASAPAFSDRISTPSRSFTSGASFAIRFMPSKIAFTSSTSYSRVGGDRLGEVVGDAQVDGLPVAGRVEAIVHRRGPRAGSPRGTRRTRGCPAARGRAWPASSPAPPTRGGRPGTARTPGCRARRSWTGRCGRRAARAVSGRHACSASRSASTASLAAQAVELRRVDRDRMVADAHDAAAVVDGAPPPCRHRRR